MCTILPLAQGPRCCGQGWGLSVCSFILTQHRRPGPGGRALQQGKARESQRVQCLLRVLQAVGTELESTAGLSLLSSPQLNPHARAGRSRNRVGGHHGGVRDTAFCTHQLDFVQLSNCKAQRRRETYSRSHSQLGTGPLTPRPGLFLLRCKLWLRTATLTELGHAGRRDGLYCTEDSTVPGHLTQHTGKS